MEKRINVAELLKDCPSGMELDCAIYDNCTFDGIEDVGYIEILVKTPSGRIRLTKEGCFTHNDKYAKCVIFPKGKTTWEGFIPPCRFKDGDVVVAEVGKVIQMFILKEIKYQYHGDDSYVGYCYFGWDFNSNKLFPEGFRFFSRLATEREKEKLFKAIKDNGYKWNAETKTLEKLSPNFRECSDNEPLDIPTMTTEFVKEHGLPCPNGYVFKDENGNVINTTKIVLEKIKKEYPKTFVEVLDFWYPDRQLEDDYQRSYKKDLIKKIQDLLYARDAYRKIAGEEMGLDGPWKPDWKNGEQKKYCIHNEMDIIRKGSWYFCNATLAFPTEEMRDAFYENFKNKIEQCKELL